MPPEKLPENLPKKLIEKTLEPSVPDGPIQGSVLFGDVNAFLSDV